MVDLDSLYSGNTASSNGGLNLDSLYSGQTQNNTGTLDDLYDGSISPHNGKINLNTIEQIESAGDNTATSKTGAKGLYQFMPDTAYEYSKRLFGKGTRDASALSAEQQNEMANAYFNDLLKEFNGNVNEAVAAYNWGQGNVEKDIKAHGSDWLKYAPLETQEYVVKYDKLSGDKSLPEKKHNSFDSFMMGAVSELNNAGDKLRGWLHLDSDESKQTQKEVAKRVATEAEASPLAVGAGQAVGATIPLIATYGGAAGAVEAAIDGAGAIPVFLASNIAGSSASQLYENGDINLKQLGKDLVFSGIGEGGVKLLSKFGTKQISTAFEKLMNSKEATPEVKEAVRKYLAHTRVNELGMNWQALREENPNATLLDAYKEMLSQAPDLAKSPEALSDMYAITKGYKNSGSPLKLMETNKALAQTYRAEAEALAKDAKSKRVLSLIADANSKTGAIVPEEELASTPLQKVGQKLDNAIGFNTDKLAKMVSRNKSIEAYRPEAEQLIKDLKKDTDRINRELRKIDPTSGITAGRRYTALRRQTLANTKMREALRAGLNGKKLKVNDLAAAVKDVQEEQFNSGASQSLTTRYQELADKFAASSVATLERSKSDVIAMGAEYAIKKGAVASVAAAAQFFGIPVPVLMAAASGAGMAARASRKASLKFAQEMVERVESGTITPEEAKAIIEARAAGKAKVAGRLGAALSEHYQK
ncbi:lytic transglycosylase, catalytic [Klebsiella quasipneumoniae]|uniref:lytic transglycosylase domain-containing protein n=1 Tax=Klebsiella quasipneumoniae TaxID=1463165 RepID=UPI0005DFC92F|nr:lytic transglycosylase domain-containing protein [Klebsiella quasipneumoniae]CEL82333.1 lytic transglycosylase, catalytic [Klebsiella quasipneumoniae]